MAATGPFYGIDFISRRPQLLRPRQGKKSMRQFVNELIRYVERMDVQQWFFLLLVVVVLGAFCLRGFGSRSQY